MILHITSRTEWNDAQVRGEYIAPSLQTEGFIHCSTNKFCMANAFYRGKRPGVVATKHTSSLSLSGKRLLDLPPRISESIYFHVLARSTQVPSLRRGLCADSAGNFILPSFG
jgi:hypothetical protein